RGAGEEVAALLLAVAIDHGRVQEGDSGGGIAPAHGIVEPVEELLDGLFPLVALRARTVTPDCDQADDGEEHDGNTEPPFPGAHHVRRRTSRATRRGSGTGTHSCGAGCRPSWPTARGSRGDRGTAPCRRGPTPAAG